MNIQIFEKGFNYSQDGPGNRLVYHLSGCNLICPWCANPEGMRKSAGRAYEIESVAEEVCRSKMMFFDGGGVTFTGGEPTVQSEALGALLELLKEQNIHTALETNGTHPHMEELLPHIDFLMMDYKQVDNEKHRHFTGMGNKIIHENIKKAVKLHGQLLLRIPFIHGVNDDSQDIEAYAAALSEFAGFPGFTAEILPYHEYGKEKWKTCGLTYQMSEAYVTEEQVQNFQERLAREGISVIHT